MEQGLAHLHNLMRWVILLFGLITLFTAAGGMGGSKAFTAKHRRNAMFLMISADIQLLLGFFLYYQKGWFNVLKSGGEVMSNSIQRFWAVEHIAGMLLAIVLIHIGYSSVKKNIPDSSKFKKLFWFTLIAFIVIIATIPWPFREMGIARGWFPGMPA